MDDTDDERVERVVKPLSKKRVAKFAEEQTRRGVVYLSKLPPFFTPGKLRSLLEKVGRLDRVYLRAETEEERRYRVKGTGGGGRRVNFREAWVEFLSKHDAKRAEEMLHNRAIGGKKKNNYHDDLWCIRFLPQFKWNDLTEDAATERRERDKKLREEISQARKERDEFLARVDKSKAVKAISERKRQRRLLNGDKDDPSESKKVKRKFPQRPLREGVQAAKESQVDDNLLNCIFGSKRRS